jgi:hypothetical protein
VLEYVLKSTPTASPTTYREAPSVKLIVRLAKLPGPLDLTPFTYPLEMSSVRSVSPGSISMYVYEKPQQ